MPFPLSDDHEPDTFENFATAILLSVKLEQLIRYIENKFIDDPTPGQRNLFRRQLALQFCDAKEEQQELTITDLPPKLQAILKEIDENPDAEFQAMVAINSDISDEDLTLSMQKAIQDVYGE